MEGRSTSVVEIAAGFPQDLGSTSSSEPQARGARRVVLPGGPVENSVKVRFDVHYAVLIGDT